MNIDPQKQKVQQMRTEFEALLKSTNRENVDYVIEDLADLGFFEAPASTKFHLNYNGGLVEHSINVCKAALMLREQLIAMKPSLEPYFPKDSVIVASLLHDVCKSDIYKPTIKKHKNEYGILVDEPGYDVDYSNFPLGHGEKSVVVILRCGFDLTDDEILAIRWHMTAWDLPFQSPELKNCINTARDKCPLCGLIQSADCIAANLLERAEEA